jgi:hypothetical protein
MSVRFLGIQQKPALKWTGVTMVDYWVFASLLQDGFTGELEMHQHKLGGQVKMMHDLKEAADPQFLHPMVDLWARVEIKGGYYGRQENTEKARRKHAMTNNVRHGRYTPYKGMF